MPTNLSNSDEGSASPGTPHQPASNFGSDISPPSATLNIHNHHPYASTLTSPPTRDLLGGFSSTSLAATTTPLTRTQSAAAKWTTTRTTNRASRSMVGSGSNLTTPVSPSPPAATTSSPFPTSAHLNHQRAVTSPLLPQSSSGLHPHTNQRSLSPSPPPQPSVAPFSSHHQPLVHAGGRNVSVLHSIGSQPSLTGHQTSSGHLSAGLAAGLPSPSGHISHLRPSTSQLSLGGASFSSLGENNSCGSTLNGPADGSLSLLRPSTTAGLSVGIASTNAQEPTPSGMFLATPSGCSPTYNIASTLPSEVLALGGGAAGGSYLNLETSVKTTSTAMAEIATRLMDLIESTQPEKESQKMSLARELLGQAAPSRKPRLLGRSFSGPTGSRAPTATSTSGMGSRAASNQYSDGGVAAGGTSNSNINSQQFPPQSAANSVYPPGVDPATKIKVLGQTYYRFGAAPVSVTILTAFVYILAPLEPLGDSSLGSKIFALSLLFFLIGYTGIYAMHQYCVVVELHRRCRNTLNVFVQRTVADIGLFPTVRNTEGGGLMEAKEGGPTNPAAGVHGLPKSFLTVRAMKAMNVIRDGALRIIPKALLINGDIRLNANSMDYFIYRDASRCCKLFDVAKAMLLHFPIRLRPEVFPPPKRHPNMCLSEGIEEVEDTSDDDDGESEPRSTAVGNSIPSVPAQMEYFVHRLMVLMWFIFAAFCFLFGFLRYWVADSFYSSSHGVYVPAKYVCSSSPASSAASAETTTTTLIGGLMGNVTSSYRDSLLQFPSSVAVFVHEALLLPTVATLGFIPLAIAGMSRVMTLVCNGILFIFFLQLQRFGPPLSPEKAILNAPSWTEIKLVTRRILSHVFTGYDTAKPIAFARNLLETLGTTTVVGTLDATGILTDMIPVPQKILFINENPYGDGVHGSDTSDTDSTTSDDDDSTSSTSTSCERSSNSCSSTSSTTSRTASMASTVSVKSDGGADSDTSSKKARAKRRVRRQKRRERQRRYEEKERRKREKLGNFMTPQARSAAKAKDRALKVQVKRKKFQEQRFTTLSTYLSGKEDLAIALEDREVEKHKTSVNALGLCCLVHALHTAVHDSESYTASLRHVDRTNFWAKCLHWLPRALSFKDSDASHYQVVRRVHMIESDAKGSSHYPPQLTALLAVDCHLPEAPLHLFVVGSTHLVAKACDTYWTGTCIEEFDDYEKEEVVYVAKKQFEELQGLEAVSCAHRILPMRYKRHLMSGVGVRHLGDGTSQVVPVEHFFIDGKEVSESSAEEIRAGRNQGQNRHRRSQSVPTPYNVNRAFPTKRIVRSLSCGEPPRNTEGHYQKDESVNARNMISLMMSSGHSFLGMVGLQDNVRPHVESAVNILNDAGIRFMYFGAGSENATKAHGKRFGLETGWNSCISLKAESVALDPQSIRAQLPFGVKQIRQHIVHVDPIPLQVSLFSHCRGHSTRAMVSVLQDNHEVCTVLGCSLAHCNVLSFVQADVAVSATATPLGSPALSKASSLLPREPTHTCVAPTASVDEEIAMAATNSSSSIFETRESWYLNTFGRVWGGDARPVAANAVGIPSSNSYSEDVVGARATHSGFGGGGSASNTDSRHENVGQPSDSADRSWVYTGNLASAAPATTRSLRNVSDVFSAMCSLKLNDSINSLPIITVLIRESRNMLRSLSSILDFIAGASLAVALLQVVTIVCGLPLLLTEGTTSFFLFVLIPLQSLSTIFDTGSWDCMTAVIAKHSYHTRTRIFQHKTLIFASRYPITILFVLVCGAISVSSLVNNGASRADPTDVYINVGTSTVIRETISEEVVGGDRSATKCVVVEATTHSDGMSTTSVPNADNVTSSKVATVVSANSADSSRNPFWHSRVLLFPQVDLVPVRVFTAVLLNVMLSIHALTYVTRHRYLTLRWKFRNAVDRKHSVPLSKCRRWFTISILTNVLGFMFQQCSLWAANWDETELESLLVSGTFRALSLRQQQLYKNVFLCIPAGVPVACIVVGFIGLPVLMLVLDYPLKRWRYRRFVEMQKYRRLAFGTRLGMHSPQGDYEPDNNNANATATAEQALMDELKAQEEAEEAAGNGDGAPLRDADQFEEGDVNKDIYSESAESLQMMSAAEGGASATDTDGDRAASATSHGRRPHHHHHHHSRRSPHHHHPSTDELTGPKHESVGAGQEMSHGDGSDELWAHRSGLLPRGLRRFLFRFLTIEEGRLEGSCVCCDHPDGSGGRAKYQLMNLQ